MRGSDGKLLFCEKKRGSLEGLYGKDRGKPHGLSEVSLKLIAVSGGLGIQVMAEICQCPRWIWNAS